MVRASAIACVLAALLLPVPGHAESGKLDPALRDKGRAAIDRGLDYLRGQQAEDGSWSKSVGVTAIALRAFLESHHDYRESDDAFITKPIAFILQHVNPDGSIAEGDHDRSYNTAVALVALKATGNAKYDAALRNGQKFLMGHQLDEGEHYTRDQPDYGGIGYGSNGRADLSNHYMALEALRATALDRDDPTWKKALVFIERCQNRSESNDQAWAANDGGFTYSPGLSPHGGTASYGGMTHSGLISLLFAGVDKNDPRVQAAYQWIRAHYTLNENPGTPDRSGLYYYYTAFAQSMAAYDTSKVVTPDGVAHNWREDYIRKMLTLQSKDDGSWVNADSPKWWEGDKNLTTARIIVGLNLATR